MSIRTICNPMNLPYQYRWFINAREGADPFIVIFKDKYYLFFSSAGGYFVSDDLAEWKHIQMDMEKYPIFCNYAPGACVIEDKLYVVFFGAEIICSDNPLDPDSWETVNFPHKWADPAMLYDGGYVYMYAGCSPDAPLEVWKLDPKDNMNIVEGPITILHQDKINHGFERKGQNNELINTDTWLEGAWVHKHNGKYYLTYAVPGTEYWTYCDGCCVADDPMGPFTFCDNSPVAFKSTGFVRGAGHGCMFEDKTGRWWRVATTSVNVNHGLERRIALFPVKHAEDGRLYTNTFRGDYPTLYPGDNPTPFETPDVGWEHLSYGKTATASSTLDKNYSPDRIYDENNSTLWSAKTADAGEWIQLDLEKIYTARAVQINLGDLDIEPAQGGGHGASKYIVEYSTDGESYSVLVDRSRNEYEVLHDYIQLDKPTNMRYIKVTNCGPAPAGGKFAISAIRVFGDPDGNPPEKSPEFTAVRCSDPCKMYVAWDKVDGAQGYYVRLGVDPGEMHIHYTVYGECDLNIGCLNAGVKYYLTVDSFNEAGIVKGTKIIEIE
ncbi:MAG: hypothetical protein E7627_02800 [Ruminococcaceae bacterium]|nr:hypothetical protein [Oscillospiraceae bacterium]